MRRLRVLVTGKSEDCSTLRAVVAEFNECNMFIKVHQIMYPSTHNKEDIYAVMFSDSNDFSMVVDHIGGRPNDR